MSIQYGFECVTCGKVKGITEWVGANDAECRMCQEWAWDDQENFLYDDGDFNDVPSYDVPIHYAPDDVLYEHCPF
jgi:hypothetical protein